MINLEQIYKGLQRGAIMNVIIIVLLTGCLIASLIRNYFYFDEVARLKKDNEILKMLYGDCKDDTEGD